MSNINIKVTDQIEKEGTTIIKFPSVENLSVRVHSVKMWTNENSPDRKIGEIVLNIHSSDMTFEEKVMKSMKEQEEVPPELDAEKVWDEIVKRIDGEDEQEICEFVKEFEHKLRLSGYSEGRIKSIVETLESCGK